ncbi:MAG: aspartate/glutamate racemase family protein [Kouleothrix sp.]
MQIKVINGNTFQPISRQHRRWRRPTPRQHRISQRTTPAQADLDRELLTTSTWPIYILKEIIKERSEFDAFIMACWGDPGIEAAREITSKPVVGIAGPAARGEYARPRSAW